SFVSAQSSSTPESAIPQGRRVPAADHCPATDPDNLERRHLHEPTKLTKPNMTPPEGGFVRFVGVCSRPISESEISTSASFDHRRNPPNYRRVLEALASRCPDHIEPDRWRQAVEDARRFLATWGAQAQALGWTA